jgi:hypothetical protein
MSEQDESRRREHKSEADQTLLGVAPPRIDSSAQLPRSPVYVRSGTSVADVESAPQAALPSAPPPAAAASRSEIPVAIPAKAPGAAFILETSDRLLRVARRRPALWMVAAPVVAALLVVWLGHHGHVQRSAAPASSAGAVALVDSPVAAKSASVAATPISELEAKPPGSLSSRELLRLADTHSEAQRAAARTLRRKVEDSPVLAKDSAVQSELLRLAEDDRTARDALAAMALLEPPVGADLLYETWTRMQERTDATELARALLYSPDVRPTASPALAVALELRTAETCEQYKAILPSALKEGDRRALHLLSKLTAKRGCGPKKTADCFACLREPTDELTATINAVKSRHPPSYTAQ